MKKGMKSAFAATLALTACFGGISAYAAHDENLNVYTLDTVVVEADKTKNKFGDTITETVLLPYGRRRESYHPRRT